MSGPNVFWGKGFFENARRLVFWNPVLVDNSIVNHITTEPNDSIKLLEAHIIQGAAHDSSERYPPPSCHPGTRLEFCGIIESWMQDSNRPQKVLSLQGPAGVGKSAIMQTVVQMEDDSPDSTLGATIFFSRPNERDDPKRLFTTIAYQLAIRYTCYRQYITEILAHDPQIVVKSIPVQFKWFIVKPFVERDLFHGLSKAVSIFLDGMDECKGEEAQRELILLIGSFALQYPDVPLIWVIASRPEPHIHSAFSDPQIQDTCKEIVVPVDSNQACADVECFLRDKFNEIRKRYWPFFPQGDQVWPSEVNFLKITNAASGHFLFAELVVRFIIDESYGNPVSQLRTVLAIIDSTLSSEIQSNPFALLDNLYTQILSSIPLDVLPTTRLLLAWSFWKGSLRPLQLTLISNLLNLDQATTYGALRKLHSVIQILPPSEVWYWTRLTVFHASFNDYLESLSRSGKYYTTLTDEEAMAHIVRPLLESHNSANSTIEPSRIQLSWIPGEHDRRGSVRSWQRWLWNESFMFTVSLIDVISSMENTPEYLDQLVIFFEDVDYAGVSAENPHWQTPFALSLFSKRDKILTVLEDWGLARTISLESITLDSVGPGTVVGWEFVAPSDAPSFLTGGDVIELRTTGTNWRDSVGQHLDGIAQFHPPVQVILIGKGSKSAIWITPPDQGWYYTFPYNQT